jgi:misacylated tRNA(Ala) deacylase
VPAATDPLYLADAYCKEFEAHVVNARDRAVCLDRSAFYPGGGGLPADQGVIIHDHNETAVTASHREGVEVWHELDGPGPASGVIVRGRLDWPSRYGVMRHHTAIHILCGVVYRLFSAVATGGQIRADRARIDFSLADLTPERVRQIEEAANTVVQEDRPIRAYTVPRAALATHDLIRTKEILVPEEVQEVRIVEIAGFDAQADGGVHVSATHECGHLRIVKTENKGKQNKRLEISLA